MSRLDLRKMADSFFKKYRLSDDKVGHSKAVAECAWRIATRMKDAGLKVDKDAAYAGALLHDIGIVKSPNKTEADEEENPWPEHAVDGAIDALKAGFPESVAAGIQNHEGGMGFNKTEMKELKLPPPAVGETWESDLPEAKIAAFADQLVYMVRHMNSDPWKDRDLIVRANLSYLNTLYKKRTGKGISKNHPILKRLIKLQDEMLQYAKPEDVPPAWKGISILKPTD